MERATPPSTATTPYFTSTVTPGVRSLENPPYALKNINGPLGDHAVSPNATHVDGVLEYDVHNLYGHQILNATYHGLLEVFPGKRPFIIGRSTFAGSGTLAGHWGGDNTSLFAYMYFGISQALNFALFGIPMVRFYKGDANPEPTREIMLMDPSSVLTPVVSTATRTKSFAIDGCSCPLSFRSIGTTIRSPRTHKKRTVCDHTAILKSSRSH